MDVVEFYVDASHEWRWRRKAPNGEVVSDGAEGYKVLASARSEAERQFGDSVTYEVRQG